ncbi:hypothetical protein BDY21DRAFT_354797 [Lineolata rhizophorae]|uniref:Uncharacterized protein n=1 Tax=Lineolata rhizophorae TaxID=578093 RepID=A0A6A6NQW3_9PEZI|nr:hypothetical protein BDY21DRAFT_354797 [Lineolata rhizophorae]
MSAEEAAAEASERESAQRGGRRDGELEAEREDAEQHLLDEFERMESYERRVKALKEKREALRKAREGRLVEDDEAVEVEDNVTREGDGDILASDKSELDDDEWDEFDSWRFRGR